MTSAVQQTPTFNVKLIRMGDESQMIIHSLLTENKSQDYDYAEQEKNCRPANVLHAQEVFEIHLK